MYIYSCGVSYVFSLTLLEHSEHVYECKFQTLQYLALTPGAVIDVWDYRNLNCLTLGFECTVDRLADAFYFHVASSVVYTCI